MKLSKSLLQMAAVVVIALLGAAGAGCSPSSTAMASDPTPMAAPAEPTTMPAEPTIIPAEPTTMPVPVEPTTAPPLRLPTLPDKLPQQASPADRTTATAEVGSSAQGSVYTWQDGDRTMRVVLQTDLVVQKTETNEPGDVLVVRVGAPQHRAEEGRARHGRRPRVPLGVGRRADDASRRHPARAGP